MNRICQDRGLTWSRHCWLGITQLVPSMLIQGLSFVSESTLSHLDPFYAGILYSYTNVNNVFYEWNKRNKEVSLPTNLWGTIKSKKINRIFIDTGYFTSADLPWDDSKIDYRTIQQRIKTLYDRNIFLNCYAL